MIHKKIWLIGNVSDAHELRMTFDYTRPIFEHSVYIRNRIFIQILPFPLHIPKGCVSHLSKILLKIQIKKSSMDNINACSYEPSHIIISLKSLCTTYVQKKPHTNLCPHLAWWRVPFRLFKTTESVDLQES